MIDAFFSVYRLEGVPVHDGIVKSSLAKECHVYMAVSCICIRTPYTTQTRPHTHALSHTVVEAPCKHNHITPSPASRKYVVEANIDILLTIVPYRCLQLYRHLLAAFSIPSVCLT